MTAIRLGDLLVKAKVITETQLLGALSEQQKWGGRLGEILVRMDLVHEELLVKALSKQLNIPAVNLEELAGVAVHVRNRVPLEVARELSALPLHLRDDGKTLAVVMAEPQNGKHLDTLRTVTRLRIQPHIAGRQAIARAFGRFYGGVLPSEALEGSGNFKMLDTQGNPVAPPSEAPPPPARPPFDSRQSGLGEVPATLVGKSPRELLEALTEAQIREVGVLKGIIALLIEKGVFTREEYLAKVRR
jgi:hypothetical protein